MKHSKPDSVGSLFWNLLSFYCKMALVILNHDLQIFTVEADGQLAKNCREKYISVNIMG